MGSQKSQNGVWIRRHWPFPETLYRFQGERKLIGGTMVVFWLRQPVMYIWGYIEDLYTPTYPQQMLLLCIILVYVCHLSGHAYTLI